MTGYTERELQIIEGIKEALVKHAYVKVNDGGYSSDVYLDRGDELREDQIKNIANAEDKMQAFYDELDEWNMNCMDNELDYLSETVQNKWNEEKYGELEVDEEDFVCEWIREEVAINFPYDELLKQDVTVNIMMDTGDGNYDYTLNNFLSYNASEDEEIEEESSILWLVRQQGYTKEDLEKAIKEGTENNFLKSVIQELLNVSTHMNALTFFVKMSLRELIDLENKKTITVSKYTSIGLLDVWSGAGGTLEIVLERDVVIPLELADVNIDGGRGYSADSIYGLMNSFWTDSVIAVI